jgi:hypothetical protein
VDAAQWIEDLAAAAARDLAAAESRAASKERPEFRRIAIDVGLLVGVGRFFGARFRSGVLYRIFERTGDRAALEACLQQYRAARTAWADLANRAKGVYLPDITVGENPQLRGHWLDRLPAIDKDIEAVSAKLPSATAETSPPHVAAAIREALGRPTARTVASRHTPAAKFKRGQPLEITIAVEGKPALALLHYRRVNHAERFQKVEMKPGGPRYQAVIPATYSDSPYPLQYYFEVKSAAGVAALYPGFSSNLTRQPYFVVRSELANA